MPQDFLAPWTAHVNSAITQVIQATKEEYLSRASKNERRFVFGKLGTGKSGGENSEGSEMCLTLEIQTLKRCAWGGDLGMWVRKAY